MKVEVWDKNLVIVPETDFEKEWLSDFKIGEVFHKYGLSTSLDYYLGLKINNQKESEAGCELNCSPDEQFSIDIKRHL